MKWISPNGLHNVYIIWPALQGTDTTNNNTLFYIELLASALYSKHIIQQFDGTSVYIHKK